MSSSINIPSTRRTSSSSSSTASKFQHRVTRAHPSPPSSSQYTPFRASPSSHSTLSHSVDSSHAISSSSPSYFHHQSSLQNAQTPSSRKAYQGKGKARIEDLDDVIMGEDGEMTFPSSNPGQRGLSNARSASISHFSSPDRSRRRSSLMGPEFLEAEHTVVDVGCDGNVRLITCVKASQGFIWNQDIFLPSYLRHGYGHSSSATSGMDAEMGPDPIVDIILTEEEMENLLP